MNEPEQECALLIFIKNIEKGKVKTRLAATVGAEKALLIYKALLNHTRTITESLPIDKLLFYSEKIEHYDNWSPEVFNKKIQITGDLGEKMKAAFQAAFRNHDKVVIIGSDCASLSEEILVEAFQHLSNHDFVIGPALDGGYYLIGMRAYMPAVFEEMAWSTDKVLSATIAKIKELNKRYALLPPLSDIDYEEDWQQYGWEITE